MAAICVKASVLMNQFSESVYYIIVSIVSGTQIAFRQLDCQRIWYKKAIFCK